MRWSEEELKTYLARENDEDGNDNDLDPGTLLILRSLFFCAFYFSFFFYSRSTSNFSPIFYLWVVEPLCQGDGLMMRDDANYGWFEGEEYESSFHVGGR